MTTPCHQKPLKLVLSGPGLIGKKHTELIEASATSTMAGIIAPRSEKNLAYAQSVGVPLFDTVEDALDSQRVDGVIIASPNEFHAKQALASIERSVPVLVEKPLAADIESATEIWKCAQDKGVPVLVGHHRTYSQHLEKARDFINSPLFGDLVAFQGSAIFRKPESYFESGPWRARLGGGPILINLIHEIGVMRFLCGEIAFVSAIASHKARGFEVEDTVAINLVFENGAIGTFILSDVAASDRSWELTSGENPAYPRSPDADCYHFAGTNGSLDFPTMRGRYYDNKDEPSWWREFVPSKLDNPSGDPLERQLAHFEAIIRKEASPLVTAHDGLTNMRVLEAVRKAINSETTIRIDNA